MSICHPDNLASQRVMVKLGFTRSHDDVVPDGNQPVVVHRARIGQLILH